MAIEQVANLNSDIEKLRNHTNQAEAMFKKIDEITKFTHKINPRQKESFLKFLKLSKQRTLSEIGYYKNHVETIRKISPKTATRLEKMINLYERTGKVLMDTISSLERVDTTRVNTKQMIGVVDELENALKRQSAQSKNLESYCDFIDDFMVDVMNYFEK
ncbi:MAG: hypothetical protein ACE5R3_04035 [Nitrosopumilaceae archaeon]